ncbi:hypothetical protein ANCCAN_00123, partial [Ancylostoma caninum]
VSLVRFWFSYFQWFKNKHNGYIPSEYVLIFEAIYWNLVESGILPVVPFGDIIMYTFSTGYVLWQTVIEPQAIRKGYLGFLQQITGNRIKVFNRDLYEHFGFQSKLLYPDARPELNTKYVTLNPMLYQKIMPPR